MAEITYGPWQVTAAFNDKAGVPSPAEVSQAGELLAQDIAKLAENEKKSHLVIIDRKNASLGIVGVQFNIVKQDDALAEKIRALPRVARMTQLRRNGYDFLPSTTEVIRL